MERKLTGRSGRLTWGGGLVAGAAVTALLVAGCSAPSNLGGGKPSPSPKSSTSPVRASGKYVPSKWINSKGVFVAPPDSAASASVKAQWKLDYGTLPPPVGFVKSLGHVPVVNETTGPQAVSQAQANEWGQEFLVAQGYLMYFQAEGSLGGALAVAGGSGIGAFPQVQSTLSSGGHVETIGCQLPTKLVLVSIPTNPGPMSGASASGFVESSSQTGPGGSCSIVGVSKAGQKTTFGTFLPSQYLQEGQPVQIPALGLTVWKNVGSAPCPTYALGDSLTQACPSLLTGGAG